MFKKKCDKLGNVTPDWIIVGLGNPGKKYEITRHNAGFICLDYLADKHSIKVSEKRFDALCGIGKIGDKNCLLLKPQTFMNLSGESVLQATEHYNIPAERVLVISDDVSFSVGSTRIRRNGSSGGQNGIKNIIDMIGTQEFPRIKVGVGKRPDDVSMVDWVLSIFEEDEMKDLNEAVERVSLATEEIINNDIDSAMGKYNKTV